MPRLPASGQVLSVIAQQVLCIQQAIVQDVKTFEFDGNMIPLNKGFGVFITMNPGYAGRTEVRRRSVYSPLPFPPTALPSFSSLYSCPIFSFSLSFALSIFLFFLQVSYFSAILVYFSSFSLF